MLTVIDILNILSEGENYIIKVNDYNKITNDVEDEFDLFERKDIPLPTPFCIVGSDTRVNISVHNKIYGQVKLNPRQANRVGLPHIIQTNPVSKKKTIIRDGKLNFSNMDLIVDLETCLKFTRYNIPFKRIQYKTSLQGVCINLDISGYELIDYKNVDISLDEILNNVKNINILKAKQKVLNSLIKSLRSTFKNIAGFSYEQTQLLYDHGINDKLQYIGISPKQKQTIETYTGNVVNFKLKGSSMSPFNNVLEKVSQGKQLNELDTVQYEYYEKISDKLENFISVNDKLILLNSELNKIQKPLSELKLRNVLIKMLMINSPISEIAFDTTQPVTYNGLTIDFEEQVFTK